MVQFFINRAGKHLSPSQKRELENAKRILQDKAAKEARKIVVIFPRHVIRPLY